MSPLRFLRDSGGLTACLWASACRWAFLFFVLPYQIPRIAAFFFDNQISLVCLEGNRALIQQICQSCLRKRLKSRLRYLLKYYILERLSCIMAEKTIITIDLVVSSESASYNENWYALHIGGKECISPNGDNFCIHDVLAIIESELSREIITFCDTCGVE
jgi:hypothetical protein